MSNMYVIVSVPHGPEMTDLMVTLAGKSLTFSVTSDLSKVCSKCLRKEESAPVKEISSPTPPPTSTTTSHVKGITCRSNPPKPSGPITLPVRLAPPLPPAPPPPKVPRQMLGYEEEMEAVYRQTEGKTVEEINAAESHNELGTSQSAMEHIENMFMVEVKEEVAADDGPNTSSATATTYNEIDMDESVEAEAEPNEVSIEEMKKTIDMAFKGATDFDKGGDHRGVCNLCKVHISTRSHHMRRHSMKHLGYKTYECVVCSKKFNRADLCKPHFERYHPDVPQVPFKDIITDEQNRQLLDMVDHCFPKESRMLKRKDLV